MNPLNMHRRIDNIRHPRQQGLTLVELMIAMVIGLILIAGVIQIFLSSQQAYRTQESMSRIQESGRFAWRYWPATFARAALRAAVAMA